MRVAVGECETANAFRVQRGKNLRNAATAVVADEIHPIDGQSIEKSLKHFRIGGHRYILIRCDFSVAMRQQVYSYAAPHVGQFRHLMTPEISIQQHSMYEQCDRSCSLFRVADAARVGLHAMPAQCFLFAHLPPPRLCSGEVCFLQLLRALLAAHCNGLSADLNLRGVRVERAVASRTSLRIHDITLPNPKSGRDQ